MPQSPSQPAYVGRSYTLPCVRDIHSIHPQAQYTDIFRILRGKLLFSWDLAFQGKTFKKFIEESGGRIKMDPLSGKFVIIMVRLYRHMRVRMITELVLYYFNLHNLIQTCLIIVPSSQAYTF